MRGLGYRAKPNSDDDICPFLKESWNTLVYDWLLESPIIPSNKGIGENPDSLEAKSISKFWFIGEPAKVNRS